MDKENKHQKKEQMATREIRVLNFTNLCGGEQAIRTYYV